jgi:hypothetical protein
VPLSNVGAAARKDQGDAQGGFQRSALKSLLRGAHEWQGDTLVERSDWKIRGLVLNFERRLTFSEDGKELRVEERVTGPKRYAETSCKLLVAESKTSRSRSAPSHSGRAAWPSSRKIKPS